MIWILAFVECAQFSHNSCIQLRIVAYLLAHAIITHTKRERQWRREAEKEREREKEKERERKNEKERQKERAREREIDRKRWNEEKSDREEKKKRKKERQSVCVHQKETQRERERLRESRKQRERDWDREREREIEGWIEVGTQLRRSKCFQPLIYINISKRVKWVNFTRLYRPFKKGFTSISKTFGYEIVT